MDRICLSAGRLNIFCFNQYKTEKLIIPAKTMSILEFLIAINGIAELWSADRVFLGLLSSNQYDPNSINNLDGIYGSFSGIQSIRNSVGIYGGLSGIYSQRIGNSCFYVLLMPN